MRVYINSHAYMFVRAMTPGASHDAVHHAVSFYGIVYKYIFGIQHTKQKTPSDSKNVLVCAHSTTHEFFLETSVGGFRREGVFFYAFFSFRGFCVCILFVLGIFFPLLYSFDFLVFVVLSYVILFPLFYLVNCGGGKISSSLFIPGSLVCSHSAPYSLV